MNVAIVGSRDGVNPIEVHLFVGRLAKKHPGCTIVSGGARGVDSYAQEAAEIRGLPTIIHYPDWDKHGKRAGFIRNALIVRDADVVVAFTTGSRGTQHTIDTAREQGKPVFVYSADGSRVA